MCYCFYTSTLLLDNTRVVCTNKVTMCTHNALLRVSSKEKRKKIHKKTNGCIFEIAMVFLFICEVIKKGEKAMKKISVFFALFISMSLVFIGCLPLSFVGTSTEEVMASRQTSPPPTVQPAIDEPKEMVEQHVEYIIGEKGQAGGYVFYDKGSYKDGWRYMEVAPEETEGPYMMWGGSGTRIEGTVADVGKGLENTKLIVSLLGDTEPKHGGPYPALVCDNLVYNDLDDWFLPSNEELLLMHKNLIAPGLGDFTQDAYGYYHNFWSSTVDTSGNNYLAWASSLSSHNGTISGVSREFTSYTRAVRRF